MQKQHLGKYGYSYQAKVITCLLTDVEFSSRMYDLLTPEYFESEPIGWLCAKILRYFSEYHTLPTLDVLHYEIESIENPVTKTEVIAALEESIKYLDSPDLLFIKNSIVSFCRDAEMKLAIYDCVDLAADGKLEAVRSRIDVALKKGEDTNVGHDYLHAVDDRYTNLKREPVSTGWPCIDKIMQGGLSRGELGVVVGPGGSGKSWILTSLCVNALLAGNNVLFISLELSDTYVGLRHDTVLTGVPTDKLKENIESLKVTLKKISGKLTIKWYPTKSLSITGLRSALDKMALLGKKPDILIIDYADLMKLNVERGKRKDESLQELYEELRGISGEYKIPIWTASQTTRESNKEDAEFIGAEMIAESMGKHYTADFMMSIDRRGKRKKTNTAQFHIIKNRFGPDGLTMLSKMDTEHGIVEIYPEGSAGYREVKRLLANEYVGIRTTYENLMEDDL